MKKIATVFLAVFIVLGAGQAFARGQNEDNVDKKEAAGREDRVDQDGLTGNQYRLSKIESLGIMNQSNEEIGDVEEAVLSLDGKITHLIVDLKGAKGVESGKYLVPINSIEINEAQNMRLDLKRTRDFLSYNDDSDESRAQLLPKGSLRSSDFRGYTVVGRQGDRIARMDDIVVDLGTGKVVYITVTSGGFLGIGREHYAMPFDQFQVLIAEEQIKLDVSEHDLKQMNGFDTDNWPAEGQPSLTKEIGRDGLTGDLYRISKVENFGIMNKASKRVGNVVDPVLNSDGRLTHLIVDLGSFEGMENGRYLVPLGAVSMYDGGNIVLDVQRAQKFTVFNDGQRSTPDTLDTERVSQGQNPVDPDMAQTQLPEGTMRSSDFHWYDVVGTNDEVIARTEDIVVDLRTGELVYVVIGSGGFLGIGREYHAISFDLVQFDVPENLVRIDMTKEEFGQLEGFDTALWPLQGTGGRVSEK